MFALRELTRPAIVAPMAGGVSTPELVAAAAAAGAMGYLAAGYRSAADVLAQIARTRDLGAEVFGVNLFVPDPAPVDLAAARTYRGRLASLADELGVSLPEPIDDDDEFDAKLTVLLDARVPSVSFTFGCPARDVVRRLHQAGTHVAVSVTSAGEAERAASAGVDALVVQGPDAGGHRATFDAHAQPPTQPLGDLLDAVKAVTDLPLVAAGGLATPQAVRQALESAHTVQLGTALLDADEAGTHPAHRRALRDPRFTETVLTRAFSGRWARGLRNAFVDEFGMAAPDAYPAVNQLTAPIRRAAAAAGDAERLSLWAGTGWRALPSGPAVSIIEALLGW